MLAIQIILIAIVLIVAFFIFFKLLKTVFKAIFAVFLLILFVTAVFGAVIYIDATKMQGRMDADQTVLLSHNGNLNAGFIFSSGKKDVLDTTSIDQLSEIELADLHEKISDEAYGDDIDRGLTLVIDSSYFVGKTIELEKDSIIIINQTFNDNVLGCAKLDSCIKIFTAAAPGMKNEITASFQDKTVQEIKNGYFFKLFTKELSESKGTFLVNAVKDDAMIIYPELTTIKLIKILPDRLVNKVLNKTIQNDTESIEIKAGNNTSN
jgi:hypothetical protein